MGRSTLSASLHVDPVRQPAGDVPRLQPHPPRWIVDLIPGAGESTTSSSVQVIRCGPLAWMATIVPGAGVLPPAGLRSRVAYAYAEFGRTLAATGTSALRFWNYLPDPAAPMGDGLDRYMVFNAGRHDGYAAWFPEGTFNRAMPTATAVGVTGDDLVIHCLASEAAGRAVQNPRQRLPWEYSSRYGPLPPTFSRGTVAVLRDRRVLLIGGTASILGEDSVHPGDPAAQLDETLSNLAAVVAQAAPAAAARHPLTRLTELRVYVAPEADSAAFGAALRERCPGAARIEISVARLCRRELLVEIEAVADVDDLPEPER